LAQTTALASVVLTVIVVLNAANAIAASKMARALLTPGLIVTVFIIYPAGRISSWTVVQYECFSRRTILAAAQNEPIGQQPLTAQSAAF